MAISRKTAFLLSYDEDILKIIKTLMLKIV